MRKTYRNQLPKGMEVDCTMVRVENGQVVVDVEFKEKFQPKDGDFLVSSKGEIFIYSDKQPLIKGLCCSYCGLFALTKRINLEFNYQWTYIKGCRFATPEEKADFLERLEKECGKRWNEEKKCLEDIRWKPEKGEVYYFIDYDCKIRNTTFSNIFHVDKARVKGNDCFKTKEAAQKVADQIKEIFKNCKAE